MSPLPHPSAGGSADEPAPKPVDPTPTPATDTALDASQELVEAAATGDGNAVEQLLERHMPGLRAFVRLRADRVVRAKESSSDLVQSVCREVLEHMDRFQYRSETGFKQWLYRTAERKIIDRFRYYNAAKRAANREVLDGGSDSGDGDSDSDLLDSYRSFYTPSHDAMVREELRQVESAFDRLPADYREIITLSRIVGLSNARIAEEMGRTEASVRNALYRGLALLSDLVTRERK